MISINPTAIENSRIFQTRVTLGQNHQSDEDTKLRILHVSLRDETKTSGLGIDRIELLYLVRALHEEKTPDDVTSGN